MTSNDLINVTCIVGARPNFMKMAPIMAAFKAHGGFKSRLIHTGQHYDVEMNSVFFEQLGLPEPDLNLEIGSCSQTVQTARIMIGLEEALLDQRPDVLLVVGDVNSTVAAALVGSKLRIPVAHVEAGLRSFDLEMPEEINRLVTDRLSDLLLITERSAKPQLESEGVKSEAIHFVGNVMIDTLRANLSKAVPMEKTLENRGLENAKAEEVAKSYMLVTLHRPSNVDDPEQLESLLNVLTELALQRPIVFTLHPRTKARIEAAKLDAFFEAPGVNITGPLSYHEMLGAMNNASLVITDSGGLQEETTALGIPCLTVRENTERPITITEGTNTLIGASATALKTETEKALSGENKSGRIPELWDGKAAERIADVIVEFMAKRKA